MLYIDESYKDATKYQFPDRFIDPKEKEKVYCLKNAQAISFAHYLMAYVEMFKRDISRLQDLKVRLNNVIARYAYVQNNLHDLCFVI